MANKILPFDVVLKEINPIRSFYCPKAYTNDLNSVEFQFTLIDMLEEELVGATANVVLYMRDKSFFQNTSASGVTLEGNVVKYVMKENEGNHAGIAQVQVELVYTDLAKVLSSKKYNFEIINGLEMEVAVEVIIQDWTVLVQEAQEYLEILAPAAAAEAARIAAENIRLANDIDRPIYHYVTQAEYDALTIEERNDPKHIYEVTDSDGEVLDELTGFITGMQTQFDNAISATTVNSETINARVDKSNVVHPTLKKRLDNDKSITEQSIVSLSNQLAEKAKQADLAVVQAQQDQLIANAGDLTNNAELTDGRISADGITYTTVGKNIRSIQRQIGHGKNYFRGTSGAFNGVTISYDDKTGTITTSGTSTLGAHYVIQTLYLTPGSYIIQTNVVGTTLKPAIYVSSDPSASAQFRLGVLSNTALFKTFTVATSGVYYVTTYFGLGVAYNMTFKIQIETGDTATKIEPYKSKFVNSDYLENVDLEDRLLPYSLKKYPFTQDSVLAYSSRILSKNAFLDIRLNLPQADKVVMIGIYSNNTTNVTRGIDFKDLTTGALYSVELPNSGIPTFIEKINIYSQSTEEYVGYAVIDWNEVTEQLYWGSLTEPELLEIATVDNRCLNGTQQITEDIDIVFPAKIPVVTGREQNIYFANTLANRALNSLQGVQVSGVDSVYEDVAKIKVIDGEANSTVYMDYFERDFTHSVQKTATLIPVSSTAGTGTNKKILFIGDSLTDDGTYPTEIANLFTSDPMDVTLLGTRGTTNKHEGRAGWRAWNYAFEQNASADGVATGATNPFYNPAISKFDFAYYMTNKGYTDVQQVYIALGSNDKVRGTHTSDADVLLAWNTIINSIRAYDPTIKIVLWLCPPTCLLDGVGKRIWTIVRAMQMRKLLLANYSNKEANKIYLCPVYLNVDPIYDFLMQTVAISDRNSKTRSICLDYTHPSPTGYYKIADSLYSMIKYLATL